MVLPSLSDPLRLNTSVGKSNGISLEFATMAKDGSLFTAAFITIVSGVICDATSLTEPSVALVLTGLSGVGTLELGCV